MCRPPIPTTIGALHGPWIYWTMVLVARNRFQHHGPIDFVRRFLCDQVVENAAGMRGRKTMITLKHVSGNVTPVLSVAFMMLYGSTALAQTATQTCRPAQVIPLTGTEPAAKIVIDAPLAQPLASRGVVVISYCAENMRIAPVFGPGALDVSPRVGHIHVTV